MDGPTHVIPTTWRLPDAPLRASAMTTKLVALLAVAALATAARTGLPVGTLYAVKASAAFVALMALSLGFLQPHHPFARFGPANQVTTVRALLVALIVSLVGELRLPVLAGAAAAGSVVVTMLDGVDGWLARRHRIASDYGARFDLEVDALLILALSVLVWHFAKAGAWVVASGAMRYVFVAAGTRWRWLRAALPRSRRRQTICVVQVVSLTVALIPPVPPSISAPVAALGLAALTWSFLVDIQWLWRRAA
jgi:phosphatidylglycerophosphate synthase